MSAFNSMGDEDSVGCLAHFDGYLPGASTLGGPHPEASNQQREPLRGPPVERLEAAPDVAFDPPANVTPPPDDQVLITHPRILHRGEDWRA